MNMRLLVATIVASGCLAAFSENTTNILENGEVIVRFDTVGAFSWTAPCDITSAEILVVGGGGGGGCGYGGGGGGGGQVYHRTGVSFVGGTVYQGSVGAGGAGGTNRGATTGRWHGDNGENTVFGGITCLGGGGGGGHAGSAVKNGVAGGNSGGASFADGTFASPAATGIDDAETGWYGGHKGGNSQKAATGNFSGGGGGAMGEGGFGYRDGNGLDHSGDGADGFACAITGDMVYYGGGGGGGANGNNGSPYELTTAGGNGGSANASGGAGGSAHQEPGVSATAGTGFGGGGGAWNGSSPTAGGNGGSGAVVIRYQSPTPIVYVRGFDGYVGGDPVGVSVTIAYPSADVCTILYAESAEGPWQTEPISHTGSGSHTIHVKVSAAGLVDFVTSAVAIAKDPSEENDGTYFFVVPAGTPGNTPALPYSTWATAANSIQAAVDAASAGGKILVKPGTYAVSSEISIAKSIVLRSFTPETGAADRDGTVIDAGFHGRCLNGEVTGAADAMTIEGFTFRGGHKTGADGGGVRFRDADGTTRSVLRNCRVTGCSTDLGNGGGACLSRYVTVESCVFDGNVSTNGLGGGVYAEGDGMNLHQARGTGLIFSGCTFTDNVSTGHGGSGGPGNKGGAAYCVNSSWFENCDFLYNVAGSTNGNSRGGAIFCGKGMTIAGCRFVDNLARNESGAEIACYGGTLFGANNMTVSNCVFRGGSAAHGAAICTGNNVMDIYGCQFVAVAGNVVFWDGGRENSATFRNCLFADCNVPIKVNSGNSTNFIENCDFISSTTCALELNMEKNRAVIRNSIFYGNKKDFSIASNNTADVPLEIHDSLYSDASLPSRSTANAGCIVGSDPRFVDAANGNYQLRSSSPCRDKGMLLGWMGIASMDLAGNPRVVTDGRTLAADPSALPDMGCYEYYNKTPGLLLIFR